MEDMLKNIRIIPRLDIKGPNLVKGIHLEGLRVLGKPAFFAEQYYNNGADELIYIDSVASLYGRDHLIEILKSTAEKIFIPITVGGGVKTIDNIRVLLRSGADKVAINTAAIHNPNLIAEAAEVFGTQCIVISIEAISIGDGKYECLTDNARERSGKNVFEWSKQVAELGAGEILVTSVDNEGTGNGFDVELIAKISQMVKIPVIASGGAGCNEHVLKAIIDGKADAVCAASIFHYHTLQHKKIKEKFDNEGNIEFLSKKRGELTFMNKRIMPTSIKKMKQYLKNNNIPCREV